MDHAKIPENGANAHGSHEARVAMEAGDRAHGEAGTSSDLAAFVSKLF
jgi:hypothetical protein